MNQTSNFLKKNSLSFQGQRNTTFKKTVNITKNGQVINIKTIKIRRKSKNFTGKNRLMF